MTVRSIFGFPAIFALVGACSSAPPVVTVSPTPANVLTCSTKTFSAVVTGNDNHNVTWSINPATVGSIDATGRYVAPIATPSPDTVQILATSVADPSVNGSANATLATAFPQPSVSITGSGPLTGGVFPHSIATSGSRAYAAWSTSPSASPSLMVARSDDSGATWKPAVTAAHVTLTGANTGPFDCMAIAIDAGSPDVVYVYGRVGFENDAGDAVVGGGASGGDTSLLAVSTDGGATFKTTVMQVGGTAGGPHGGWDSVGICGDVASPASNTVVVESPGGYSFDGNPDIAIWSDANRGAGFATGLTSPGDYLANGFTDGLNNLSGNHDITVAQNGGTNDAGNATESPRLFTDGKGALCIAYYGLTNNGTQSHAYVQCSDSTAKTFSAPLALDPSQPVNASISSPIGALGPNQTAAVLWTTGITAKGLFAATSTDGGKTFGAPVQIPTYVLPDSQASGPQNPNIAYDAAGILWIAYHAYDGSTSDRIVVDKSCDNGKTWSGAVLVNGPEGAIANLTFPTLVMTPGDAPRVAATAADHRVVFALAP